MTRLILHASVFALLGACASAPSPQSPAQRPPSPVEETSPVGDSSATPVAFEEPTPLEVKGFVVLGPFGYDGAAGDGIENDYLASIGGEATASVTAATQVTYEGASFRAREADADERGIVDFKKVYDQDTSRKVAYAAGEITVERDQRVVALFGSDDGASVWLNGSRVHHVIVARAINPNDDYFELPLKAGTNRLLVKVENGFGEWAFALRLYDEAGAERHETNQLRRHLEELRLEPERGDFALRGTFPELSWDRPGAARRMFGDHPLKVRWFDPDLSEVAAPEKVGRYVAVVETKTLDDFTHRRMLTFSKLDGTIVPWLPELPYSEPQVLDIPLFSDFNDAQRAELSRHFWSGGREAVLRGEQGAIARLALAELGEGEPKGDEPSWLSSGFVSNAEHQLALRMKLEKRVGKPLSPPKKRAAPARTLQPATEIAAGMKRGTVAKLRQVAREWAKVDSNGFVVVVARHGRVFLHEGFNGFEKDTKFWPASIGKTIAALTFAQAVDQGLVRFDDPVGSVFPEWNRPHTKDVTFRHCFYHVAGLTGHLSHGGLFNAYLDGALLGQDAAFAQPGTQFIYNGDDINLTGKALELLTGTSSFRLLYQQMQAPLGEDVTQFDMGVGDAFSALYIAKVGQMVLNGGSYGEYQLLKPETLNEMMPRPIRDYAPNIDDPSIESGIGLGYMPDPQGDRKQGVLGPNVIGHGAASGTVFRIDPDHGLVIIVGRNGFKDYAANDAWAAKFVTAVAEGLASASPPPRG